MLHHPMITLGPVPASARVQAPRPAESLAVRVFDTLFDWMERYQARRALGSMSEAQLNDVGLTRADIHREADKPFWRQ